MSIFESNGLVGISAYDTNKCNTSPSNIYSAQQTIFECGTCDNGFMMSCSSKSRGLGTSTTVQLFKDASCSTHIRTIPAPLIRANQCVKLEESCQEHNADLIPIDKHSSASLRKRKQSTCIPAAETINDTTRISYGEFWFYFGRLFVKKASDMKCQNIVQSNSYACGICSTLRNGDESNAIHVRCLFLL